MSQVISRNTPSRRQLLLAGPAVAVSLGAGTGIVGGALADPIFAAIEDHKRAYDAFAAYAVSNDKLCDVIPQDRRRSEHFDCMQGDPNWAKAGDDPAWIESVERYLCPMPRKRRKGTC
jgi:hypothetical protein